MVYGHAAPSRDRNRWSRQICCRSLPKSARPHRCRRRARGAAMANSTPFIFFAVFFLFFWSLVGSARAQPATLSFQDCFQAADGNVSEHMIISTVYGQIVGDDTAGRRLNITILGESPTEILGLSNTSTDLGECRACIRQECY